MTEQTQDATPSHNAENAEQDSSTPNAAAEAETVQNLAEAEESQKPDSPESRLKAERDEMEDHWKRAEAELANFRVRAKRDVEEARQFATQKFARDVVEAAENLRRGLASLPPVQEGEDALLTKLREGFEGTERSFLSILERNGITRHDPTGHVFDADKHQAMQEQESADHAPGHIIQAWTPTWLLNNRLLKPAMVIVASQSSTGQKKD